MLSRGLWSVLALIASCSFEPDYGDTRYICKLERCPEDYVCVDEICVTGASDAAIDDAAVDGQADSGEPPSCDDVFGTAPEYELCEESAASCVFGSFVDGSCEEMCAMFGSTCVSAQDSDAGALCVSVGDVGCNSTHSRAMCTCVR